MAESFLDPSGTEELLWRIREYIDNAIADAMNDGVPAAYTRVEYLRGDGKSWIDTGLTLDGDLTFIFESGGIPRGNMGAFVTAHNSTNSENGRQGFIVFNTNSHKIDYYWPGVPYTSLTVDANIDFAKNFKVTQNRYGIRIEQGDYSSSASYSGTAVTNTSHIICLHSENPNHTSYNYGDINKIVIAKGTIVLRKYVPVIENATLQNGLYDTENKEFYTNVGTGSFQAGPMIV